MQAIVGIKYISQEELLDANASLLCNESEGKTRKIRFAFWGTHMLLQKNSQRCSASKKRIFATERDNKN
jgi:hypothetical protein